MSSTNPPASILRLRHLLSNLPESLPYKSTDSESRYAFHHLPLDNDWINSEGIEAAVNRALEVKLGPRTGPGDTFIIVERGPGLTALADVLEVYLGKFPHDFRLKKWLGDACRAAEQSFGAAGLPLPKEETQSGGSTEVIDLSGDTSERDDPRPVSAPDPKGKGKAPASSRGTNSGQSAPARSTTSRPKQSAARQQQLDVLVDHVFPLPPDVHNPKASSGSTKSRQKQPAKIQRLATNVLDSYDDPDYHPSSEDPDTRPGGRAMDPTLKAVSRPARPVNNLEKKVVRCIASRACHTQWAWPRNQTRIFNHAVGCSWVPAEHRLEAEVKLAEKVGTRMSQSKRKRGDSKGTVSGSEEASRCTDGEEDRRARSGSSEPLDGQCDTSARSQAPEPKRVRVDSTSSPSGAKTLEQDARAIGRKELSNRADDALVLLLVDCGIPPSIVDNKRFKEFCVVLNPKYSSPSSTTVRDRLIPAESAKVHLELIKLLRTLWNLTLSFDGGKSRRPRGVYTVTITTATRQAFLYDLQDIAYVSHTGEYINECVSAVVELVGPSRFSAVVSDNAGNTRVARALLSGKFRQMLNFQDCCHEINLALLQINELDEFKDLISNVKAILAYMHKSNFAAEHFDEARRKLNISPGLTHIGTTRFSTYVSAAQSIKRCLPAFERIVSDHVLAIDITSKNALFDSESDEGFQFKTNLSKYLAVTEPFARAIQCLESAHATTADVFVFWIAIMTSLEQRFKEQRSNLKISPSTMENVRAIANQRFTELLEDGPECDVYLAAFFLDPRYRDAPILSCRSVNPLIIPPIRIQVPSDSHKKNSGASQPSGPTQNTPRDQLIERVAVCLQRLLRREYGDTEEMLDSPHLEEIMKERNPKLSKIRPDDGLEALNAQIQAYSEGKAPFNSALRPNQTPYDWWVKTRKDSAASILGVLAVKLFAVVPNSMMDERTMSTITWLNSPRRARQHVKTLRDHIKIRQWHRTKDGSVTPESRTGPRRLTVRWIDLKSQLSQPEHDIGARHQGRTKERHPNKVTSQATTGSKAVTDGHKADDESHSSDSDSEDAYNEVAEKEAIEVLKHGATFGNLHAENRCKFTVSDMFNLGSPLLQEVLGDAPTSQPQPAASGSGNNAAHTVASADPARTLPPSKAAWGIWKKPQA